ncbi:restriction endonuclease subunit S [Staphylococcus aureus]|uniref:restriction endonuclease subunit S n=1 Tax=Staphylococcus aureus TaxID=1280 RepID=UPI00215C930F|nr:restriction endonuclease subunit S [Staphylococcus aureus]UVI99421.1 restriction endonuclease subunit S [Staphylococcus aureus]
MSNTQKKNVPELRFPGFEGEYSLDIFGNLATNKSDKFNPQNENASIDIELDCIEQNTGRLIKIYNSKEFSSQKNKFNPQNVLYGKLRPYLNKYYFTKKSGVCSSEIWVLKSTKEDKLLNLFLYYFIQTKRYSDVASKSAGSKMPRADWGLIENIRVYFPELCEQQKIGEFFSKLDLQIELEEQKLELLQQQKKGYMQKIFSQELRFKDENGEDYPDWKEKKLGDITEQSMYGIGASATRFDSKNIYIRITDIDEKSRKLNYQNLTTPDELNNKYKLKRNDILFARTGASTGKSYIHKEEKDIYNYYFAGFLIKFEIDEQNNPLFIYQFTLTSKFNKWVKVMSVRSGQPGINSEEYAKLPLVLPNKLEQKKIAEFLDRFDQQIELEKQKIEILQQQKKGLLQSMFI